MHIVTQLKDVCSYDHMSFTRECDMLRSVGGSQTYLLAVQCVDPLDHATFQFNGLCDVSEDLLEGVRRFLVEQNTHGFAWLHTTAHHGHKFGSNKVLGLSGLARGLGS